MKIRKAKPEDAEEIYKLRIETIEKINRKDYIKEEIEGFKRLYSKKVIIEKIKSTEMFCIIENNKIIGTIYLQGNKIGGFFIRSDYTGKGIGSILLKFIEEYAKNKGIVVSNIPIAEIIKIFFLFLIIMMGLSGLPSPIEIFVL